MNRPTTALLAASLGATLLAGCASAPPAKPGKTAARPAYSEPEGGGEEGGIQSRAIRAAPSTQAPQNDSKPLSALNTPEAIAAREAAARRARAPAPAAAPASAAAVSAPAASTPVIATATTTTTGTVPAPAGALQKGSQVAVRGGTALYARPSTASEKLPLAQDMTLELGAQVYNAGGYWWFVTVGADTGWLLQSDITR